MTYATTLFMRRVIAHTTNDHSTHNAPHINTGVLSTACPESEGSPVSCGVGCSVVVVVSPGFGAAVEGGGLVGVDAAGVS